VINIGNPDIRSIEDLAEIVRAELGASPDLITYIDLPERMTLQKHPNLARQKELLGYEPRVSLEEGVKLVCDNMKHLFV
jgi:nucleoside-diphosphate-sugar epimerase